MMLIFDGNKRVDLGSVMVSLLFIFINNVV